MGGAGNPPANTQLGGTTLIPITCYDFQSTSGGIYHGGNVAADATGYKTILNASAYSAVASSCPSVLMLVDLLQIIPLANATISGTGTDTYLTSETCTMAISTNLVTYTTDIPTFTPVSYDGGTLPTGITADTIYWTVRQSSTTSLLATSLTNARNNVTIDMTGSDSTPTVTQRVRLPRYSDGVGVQQIIVASTASTTTSANIQHTYQNAAGTLGQVTPTTLPASTAITPLLGITYSGTGAGKYGPFMPLAAGDTGTRRLQNIILTTNGVTAGVFNTCLVKPLLTLPLQVVGVAAERDLVNQIPSMPRVYDGACLTWLIYAQAAISNNTAYYGHIDFGWS
jgi:hypothetical protein